MSSNEVSLYDASGEGVAYIDSDGGAIWTWDGDAGAYLRGEDVFGWNGDHLGWWVEERLYDADGLRAGFTRRTCPSTTRRLAVKSAKSIRPRKSMRSIIPMQPVLSSSTSSSPLLTLLRLGR